MAEGAKHERQAGASGPHIGHPLSRWGRRRRGGGPLENNGLELRRPSVNVRNSVLTAPPAKPLATRRPKVPPATSYTFALFSIKNASVVIPLLIPQPDWDNYHYKIPGQIPYLILRFSGFDSASGSVPVNVEHGCARGARATPRPSAVSAEP